MIMEYVQTEYDNKENDWLQFAKQQAKFYGNANQHICNLQLEINELDSNIEELLKEIEDANYNVAQGYKVFKHLKDLRNIKKSKQYELNCLRTITDKIDCDAMADIMGSCADEMEEFVVNGI